MRFFAMCMHMRKLKTYIIKTLLLSVVLLMPVRLWAVGWTPTDGGLVLNLEQGDRFLLSVWLDIDKDGEEDPGEEYFVYNYNRYTGGRFNYKAGLYLKLIPQDAHATEPSEMSIWTVGAPLSRVISGKDYSLGGIVYTIWNDGKTLRLADKSNFQFLGDLTSDYNYKDAADVVFVIPTDHDGITSFDPNKTLRSVYNRTDQNASTGRINGKLGTGFLGMNYREVYMLDIPRQNSPISYTNASLVTFNTDPKETKSWSNGQIKCAPGHAAYAYADDKHKPTHRTLFRLYMLDKPINSCNDYFFATDEQDVKKYRKVNDPTSSADSTAAKKVYTWDHFYCMDSVPGSKIYKTGYMNVPAPDSTYYYVGWNNDWRNGYNEVTAKSEPLGSSTAKSAFKKIRELPLTTMPAFKAPANAYGRMVVDTSETADNLGVKFEPKGYMLKVSTGKNVRMRLRENSSTCWISEEMWTIDAKWAALKIKATLMTGPEFSETDPGADIIDWTDSIVGTAVPVQGSEETVVGKSGWAVIDVNDAEHKNGNLRFILANKAKRVYYDNNGFLGTQIPDQYPQANSKTVTIEASRLKAGYEFDGWTTAADGSGHTYQPGDVVDFDNLPGDVTLERGDSVLHLYAQAHYNGTLQVAISFINPVDSKRYFLTHPNSSAPRYARARHFENWETTWQGMENAENLDPNYVSTFEVRCPVAEIKKKQKIGEEYIDDLYRPEHVLDPRSYTMKGYEDSLTFYEFFHPADDEYLGLYYTDPNTIVANNTWAGLFTTTSTATDISWPTYKTPYIPGVKIKSERYVEEYDPENKPDSLMLKERGNKAKSFVYYDPATNQFDGVATAGEATTFDVSAVVVADAHYVVIPDTTEVWRDTIDFDYHTEKTTVPVWSSLIGKQFLACMMVGSDTTYFHPNRNKIINDPNDLYLSPDFRVTQLFDLVRDSRVSAPLSEGDSVQHETTDYYWHNDIVSGNTSPINVKDKSGNYIDIVDTFRITLSHGAISRIKEYRGRWKKGAKGLKVNADGSVRIRDVIVRTKTYHYGDTTTHLMLTPEFDTYSIGPLVGQTQTIDFTLTNVTTHWLKDVKGNRIREEIIGKPDTIPTANWSMYKGEGTDYCQLRNDTDMHITAASANRVTLTVIDENTHGVNYDTLIVTKIKVNGVDQTVNVRVPITQAALVGSELVWSVKKNGKRYYIMAGKGTPDHFIFRQYTQKGTTLYKLNSGEALKKGSKDAANSDVHYITPWDFKNTSTNQLTLTIGLTKNSSDTLHFKIDKVDDKDVPVVSTSGSTALTYEFINTYSNDNANYEEQVVLSYGESPKQWLKFDGSALSLTTTLAERDTFSWGYMQQEYSLLNNGKYPSQGSAEFGYNTAASSSIQTRYKAYKEYTMLVDNQQVDLCRSEETSIDNLINGSGEWKTAYSITKKADARTFDSGSTPSPAVSGLDITLNTTTLTTSITPGSATSPTNVKIGGKYVNIVDTLVVALSESAPQTYRFKGDWSSFSSLSDANLKIPLIRKTYHDVGYDSLVCGVYKGQMEYSFPSKLTSTDSLFTFKLSTLHRRGKHVVDISDNVVDVKDATVSFVNVSGLVNMNDKARAEVRLVDEFGNTPSWCKITAKGDSTVTVKCLSSGIRAPRSAYIYLAYIVMVDHDNDPATEKVMRFVNAKLTVSQTSLFENASNQVLVHSAGASGDEPMANGMQQVHENRRILYYYPDQDVELPVRERAFYGWWRWYRESENPSQVEADIPDTDWRKKPENTGRYNYAYRTIGDTVWTDKEKGEYEYKTMGRWTVFHYKSKDYNNRLDPPAKNPYIAPPSTEYGLATYRTDTIAVDISNYYDNLPMSVSHKNQVDTAMLDTMRRIPEPTLSLREVFELHPWTEMADTLEHYKTHTTVGDVYPLANEQYMEDHVMMAPIGNALLLKTEQRYNLDNIKSKGFSESLLGYYMRDDNWSEWSDNKVRQDTMIWCGGWDADCLWYTYDTTTQKYTECTYSLTVENDFLNVPAKTSITAGQEFDTVYYCLRARSWKSTFSDADDATVETVEGDNWFNICRYKIIYHNPELYGPKTELNIKGVTKAIITNKEIEQKYEVLERLNFDYIKPGRNYHIYPHPLPWADASYGYTYPETPDLPHNRLHEQSDFPNYGEYGLINRIPYSQYWHMMEQHGGAENGYMIYCDGMASAGQVAALSLETKLCEGQKMFFSGYVGNPSSQSGKANPNFIFSVQGKKNGAGNDWEDITSYMTGDIKPSNRWSQICFPILQEREYDQFRVRIYNQSSNFDGNDFIIDDMCIFATKPPLIAYQASTACVEQDSNDSLTHVIIRVDYKGISGEDLNGANVYYTIQGTKGSDTTFIPLIDHYFHETTAKGASSKPDTIFGYVQMPSKEYTPEDEDSIFSNVSDLLARFDTTVARYKEDPSKWFRTGYVLESLEGAIRPVLYFIHAAKMAADIRYKVRMANAADVAHAPRELMSSMCAMTSDLKVSNRMLLEINGEEQPEMEIIGMCANATYNLSLRIKSSAYIDSVAPIDVNGSCINDWLLYGDTVPESSKTRYGYYYDDIVKMVTKILRCEEDVDIGKNKNQFVASLGSVSRAEMERIQKARTITFSEDVNAYDMLVDLVNKGFLTLYKRQITVTVNAKDSVEYMIMPIIGTGSDAMNEQNMEVCPYPLYIKLQPDEEVGTIPLIIGGLRRDSTEAALPVTVLVNENLANDNIAVKIDSIEGTTAIHSVVLLSTDDPEFIEGVHSLTLVPERIWHLDGQNNDDYYKNGDTLVLRPASGRTYHMKAGYNYTFIIKMMTITGSLTAEGSDCKVGEIPFTVGVVPNYMRWDPQSKENNQWNNADNWMGVDEHNEPIPDYARFAPMGDTYVIIPAMTDGKPYPVLPPMPTRWEDSIQKVNFEYDTCQAIRFLPGAAIGQQQHMRYNDAVVDMPFPQQKWAFRSTPVNGMVSGDLYMAEKDLNDETPLWEVGEFDAAGRTYKTGNASFWLSVYSRQTIHKNPSGEEDSIRSAAAEWSKVTNGLKQPLANAQGWAVYARTASKKDAAVRLPKTDDVFYYYGTYGERIDDRYEDGIQAYRASLAGSSPVGKLAFYPDDKIAQTYTLSDAVEDTSFVFGNPTMGYIDIWGFINDNCLRERFDYMDETGSASIYRSVSKAAAEATENTLTNLQRYLPPMHAIVVKKADADKVTAINVTVGANRIVTDAAQISRPLISPCEGGGDQGTAHAPGKAPMTNHQSPIKKGIMTVTAINPCSPRCTSYLLLGQGYHDAILEGEDAVLTTVNIDAYTTNTNPSTPFNIYAVEGSHGLSIDLRNEIVSIPLSFYMSDLPYDEITRLWFTGVNSIDGRLFLYDAWTDTERPIIDGLCLAIETPQISHQQRYFIRRIANVPDDDPEQGGAATGVGSTEGMHREQVFKFIYNGQVYIARNGHVYSIMGQIIR